MDDYYVHDMELSFCVFYFLLNEEVQAVYKASSKKKNLSHHGFDFSPTSYMEDVPFSAANENAIEPGSPSQKVDLMDNHQSPRPCRSQDGQHVRSRRNRNEIEVTSSDED
ncbi:hypothetical protein CAPTEDRAFT_193692 [Capitella teleta]|uniref:Uncharacterized protein n=1 Tax=Capitella teleta TaxID=283909 RepID=R7T7W0_CAPTE|nr:hypothetical protein CAPTEDRAFT_193692 [Capitella teleta]|eukprot:ELT89700.1 hypothetical protein CAPTEDRAFT_193692 [Capitella teleta]